PMPRQATGLPDAEGEPVVERHPGADIEALPRRLGERVHERHGSYEVRRDLRQEQTTLLQRLVDEAEVEHLEVAQTSVDELARPRGGSARVVARLDQTRRESAGDRVAGDTTSDDAAADDEDVERFTAGHPLDGCGS